MTNRKSPNTLRNDLVQCHAPSTGPSTSESHRDECEVASIHHSARSWGLFVTRRPLAAAKECEARVPLERITPHSSYPSSSVPGQPFPPRLELKPPDPTESL
jgi:hypothetical protein